MKAEITWNKLSEIKPDNKPKVYYLVANEDYIHWKGAYWDNEDKLFRYTPLMAIYDAVYWAEFPKHPKQ